MLLEEFQRRVVVKARVLHAEQAAGGVEFGVGLGGLRQEQAQALGRVLYVLVENRFAIPDQSQVEREFGNVDADKENKIHIFAMIEK